MIVSSALAPEERVSLKLRELYEKHGYVKYRMNKFENYDLYAENRAFLPGGGIITFTDNGGNLLAMKPDVTLSIANGLPSGVAVSEKIYYSENVYRMPRGSGQYKEIMQLGVECIGDTDVFETCEVIGLAVKSMKAITDDYIMDISHVGFVSGLIYESGLEAAKRELLLEYINRKSVHDIERLCGGNYVREDVKKKLIALTEIYAPIEEGIKAASALDVNDRTHEALSELEDICSVLKSVGLADKLYIDFSFADNTGYYDGVKFRGFVDGVYSAVLAGGSYGKLLKKLKKQAGAIGFAVYLDLLAEYGENAREYDADILLLYGETDDAGKVMRLADELMKDGKSVRVQKGIPDGLNFAERVNAEGGRQNA